MEKLQMLAMIHAYLVVTRGANQLASGLALGFFGIGLTALIGRPYVSKNIEGLPVIPVPFLSDVPFIGPILFQHDALTYLVYALGPLIWFFFYVDRILVPAWAWIGFWFAEQIFFSSRGIGGVAYMAHIGGFVAGLALVKLFATRRQLATA